MRAESIKHYFICYLSLMFLLVLTIIFSQLHLGTWSIPISMGIATVKALLILMIFMHAWDGRNYFFLIMALVFFLVAVMILTLSDFWTRIGGLNVTSH